MLLNLLITIFLFFVLITTIDSSHFLGGTITWSIQNISENSTSVAVRITQTYSWTYVAGRCDNSAIATNQVVAGSGGTLTCSPSCPSGFGTVSATPYCTDLSTLNGIAVGQRLDTVVIPTDSNFFIIFAGSAWNTRVSGGTSWSITSRINLVRRSDNNMFNNAPVATVMSPVNIQVNQTTIIPVSVSDADGDVVRCRWSNSSSGVDECSSVCPPSSLPENTVLLSTCVIEITGTIVGNMYAVTFMVEDFMNSASTTPLSSTPVQFIVKVVASPSCSTLPEVLFMGQSCTTVQVNKTFTSQLLAINYCGTNVSIVDIATLSFSGMLQSSIIELSSLIYYKILTWTPTIDQLGYQVMCAMALDSEYSQSAQYCFTFYVTETGTSTCPGATNSSIVTVPSKTIATTVPTTTILTVTVSSSTTTKTPTSNNIDWAIIASVGALFLLLAIIYSSCILYRYYKRSIGKRRLKFYNTNSVDNIPYLVSSENPPLSAAVSFDPVYTIKDEIINKSPVRQISSNDETINESPVCQTPSNDETINKSTVRQINFDDGTINKSPVFQIPSNDETINKSPVSQILSDDEKVDDTDVEQLSASSIVYPISEPLQLQSNEPDSYIQPYITSAVIRNEQFHVKNVRLPVEQMITESRPSQIETIDLPSISSKAEQLPEVDNRPITSADIVQTKLIYIMENKAKTANTYDAFENPAKKLRKTKIKHKKLSEIHVTIRKPPNQKR